MKETRHKRTNISISRIGKFIEIETRLEVMRGKKGGETGTCCLMVTEFLFGVKKSFRNSGNDCAT